MKRAIGGLVLLAALGGCVSTETGAPMASGPGTYMAGVHNNSGPGAASGIHSGVRTGQVMPNAVGPWGKPVVAAYPDVSPMNSGTDFAKATIAASVPPEILQASSLSRDPTIGALMLAQGPGGAAGGGVVPPGGIAPPGLPAVPGLPGGVPPGVPGGAGVPGAQNPQASRPPAMPLPPGVGGPVAQRTSVRFAEPAGMKISWYAPGPDGKPSFTAQSIEAPGRYNFLQAAIYRLKLTDIPGRPGVELYPTLEVVPCNQRTATFLAHSSVPVSFTEDDFQQVAAGNFLVKVIYLPDPQYQDQAITGADELVSSRLEPGVDPIAEAQKRGSILLVVRLGNIDLEAPNTPAMDAPGPMKFPAGMPMMPGGPGMMGPPGRMVPYGMGMGGMGMGPGGPMMRPDMLPGGMAPGALMGRQPGPLPPVSPVSPVTPPAPVDPVVPSAPVTPVPPPAPVTPVTPVPPSGPSLPLSRMGPSGPVTPAGFRPTPTPAEMAGRGNALPPIKGN